MTNIATSDLIGVAAFASRAIDGSQAAESRARIALDLVLSYRARMALAHHLASQNVYGDCMFFLAGTSEPTAGFQRVNVTLTQVVDSDYQPLKHVEPFDVEAGFSDGAGGVESTDFDDLKVYATSEFDPLDAHSVGELYEWASKNPTCP